MSVFKNLNIKNGAIILIVIIAISVGIVLFYNNYYKIEWVFVGGFNDFDVYYNSKLINIDTKDHIVKVWIKEIFTDKGKQEFLKIHYKDNYKNINYQSILLFFNYNNIQLRLMKYEYYTHTNKKIGSEIFNFEWSNFSPKSIYGYVVNKLDDDYKLIR